MLLSPRRTVASLADRVIGLCLIGLLLAALVEMGF